jgi:hypothetical protein
MEWWQCHGLGRKIFVLSASTAGTDSDARDVNLHCNCYLSMDLGWDVPRGAVKQNAPLAATMASCCLVIDTVHPCTGPSEALAVPQTLAF